MMDQLSLGSVAGNSTSYKQEGNKSSLASVALKLERTVELPFLAQASGIALLHGGKTPTFLVTGWKRYGYVVTPGTDTPRIYPCPGAWATHDVVTYKHHTYCVDGTLSVVHVMNDRGEKVRELDICGASYKGYYSIAEDFFSITVSNSGNLYAVAGSSRRVYKCNINDSTFTRFITYKPYPQGPRQPGYCCISSLDHLVVSDEDSPELFFHHPTGELLATKTLTSGTCVRGLCYDGEDTLYIAHWEPNGVSMMKGDTITSLVTLDFVPCGLFMTPCSGGWLVVGSFEKGNCVRMYKMGDAQPEVECGEPPFLGHIPLAEVSTMCTVTSQGTLSVAFWKDIRGVTHINPDRILVAVGGGKGPAVLTTLGDGYREEFTIPGGGTGWRPGDVTARHGQVFITDQGKDYNCIHRVDYATRQATRIKMPFDKMEGDRYCLTSSGNSVEDVSLYVTSGERQCLCMCGPGQNVLTIVSDYNTHPGLGGVRPGYLSATGTGEVVVGDRDSGRILVHNTKGQLLYQCELDCQHILGVSCDSKGRVFVAHKQPDGVSMVSLRDGTWQLALTEFGFGLCGASVSSDGTQLVVVDLPSRLHVYRLQWT